MSEAKITDLIKTDEFTYSFEVTPNIALDTIDNLGSEPLFISITWHAKSLELNHWDVGPLKLANNLTAKGYNVLLHLSCDLLKREYLNGLLQFLQEKKICNLFVFLGENYDRDSNSSDFKSTKELIEYIRKRTGNYFCIGVAGFPDQSDNRFPSLKEKIESGADFILTQAFFDIDSYQNFVKKCESQGITIPIIPGLFLYESHKELISFTNLCKVKVSDKLLKYAEIDPNYIGTDVVKKLVQDIIKAAVGFKHVHLFTLNKLERVSGFVKEIQNM
ncbi:5,10-methylenetetrahydrofolate reductase [Pectinophora gossypiella]|uniref:5,10-methylenetetrahydrofolate reductase n=1 Tax=Pectinophora gossypiella TaxID=13191 RepID=UPI00214E79B8|nr:5,10-methylenetetrahydrofolate reductase [Pectinophora gossypiella]